MHGCLAWVFILRMYLKKRKLFKKSFAYVYKRAKIGFKMIKVDPTNHLLIISENPFNIKQFLDIF